MGQTRFDVVGIGNAIVDIIGRCDDDFLARFDAPKGHMRLVEEPAIRELYDAMGPAVEISGGSSSSQWRNASVSKAACADPCHSSKKGTVGAAVGSSIS